MPARQLRLSDQYYIAEGPAARPQPWLYRMKDADLLQYRFTPDDMPPDEQRNDAKTLCVHRTQLKQFPVFFGAVEELHTSPTREKPCYYLHGLHGS